MKKYLITAIALTVLLQVQAQEADTTGINRSYAIGEVVVTGTRNATDIRHLSQTVSVVNRNRLEQAMQPSLLPVLTEQVPGLFTTSRGVMGYGVSNGAAGGISLRGLSGGNARLMVLIDGHPQYAGIFGHPIADAYQTLLADRVEVLRGPASVLYGSNAMGGVVNIVTRKMHEDGTRTNLHVGYGSYNTLETELTNRIRKGRFSSVISGSYNRTDGHCVDMGFEQYGGYGRIGYEVTDNWNLRADVNVTHFNASYPGPVSAPLLDGDQRGLIALRALSAQHVLCLAAAGALFVGPAALLAELPGAALRLCGVETAQAAAVTPDSALFLPMLLQSALLAPICEELFFRGYLMGAFARAGRGKAVAAAALLFAAAHGVDAAFLPRFLLGCLLGGMARRTGSILAPMLMHGCYNAAVLLVSFSGLKPAGNSLLFCVLGLMSAVLCFAMVARVYRARANRAPVEWGGALSRKEMAKIAAAVLAVIAAVIVSGVTKP